MEACKRISVEEATGLNVPVSFSGASLLKAADTAFELDISNQKHLETVFQSSK